MSRRSNHAHADDFSRRVPRLEDQLAGTMFSPATEPAPPVRRVPVTAHMRTVSGAPAPAGETRRSSALEDHELQAIKRATIVHVRAQLLALYRSRAAGGNRDAFVTADDADAILRAWPQFDPVLRDGSQNWRGSIFAGKGWARTGQWVPSTRDEMNSHMNPCWRPVL